MLLLSSVLYAQVGIGTVDPLADLHLAGENATIRIESVDAVNNSTYNDGVKLSKAYVDGNGDIAIGNGTGTSETPPLNFLFNVWDFVPNDPYATCLGTGTVVNNNDLGETLTSGEITTVSLLVPQDAMIEIKYGITMLIWGADLTTCVGNITTINQAVSMSTYIKVDLNSDGLVGDELTKVYGKTALNYTSDDQGIIGYPYVNGQAYLTVPAGTHTLYFYGEVRDAADSYTSVGFGGAQDFLKIRVYN